MKLTLDVRPDIAALMAAEFRAGEKAVTTAVREAGAGLKRDWRGQVTGARLGRRLAGTIRSGVYPRSGESITAAALVYTRAPEILSAHDAGGTIRSPRGLWLVVPLPAAGRAGAFGRKLTPDSWERKTGMKLRFVYRRRGPSLLVADGRLSSRGIATESRSKTGRGRTTVPIFLVVPFVRLRQRLDLDRDAEKWLARLPGMIVDSWVDGKTGG